MGAHGLQKESLLEIKREETFEERMQKLQQKQLILPPRAPSGDVRLRKQSSNAVPVRGLTSATPMHAQGSTEHLAR